jgi:hypothetical protein
MRGRVSHIWVGLLTSVCALLLAGPASAATFDVNSTGDVHDQTLNGTCATSTGACTLRAAVTRSW